MCDICLIFAQNMDCGYTLEPPKNIDCGDRVLTSSRNLCLRAEIMNNVYPCKPQFYYIKLGMLGGVIYLGMLS